MAAQLLVVDDPSFDEHHAEGHHPERPERLLAAREGLSAGASSSKHISLTHVPAPMLGSALAEAVHDTSYLERLATALPGRAGHLDADTYFSPGSYEAAQRAAGGAAAMTRALVQTEARRGFALLRPPGHHAEAGRAMGFCLLNNVAVAAEAALQAGAARVAIVDWDVHHGNGTQHIFESRRDVLFISLHQWPFYPGTGGVDELGVGEGRGATLNIPLPAGSGDAQYGAAFHRVVLPALRRHRPDIILVSAGYDAHARDPLASMNLSAEVYAAMTTALVEVAEELGHGRVGLFLEGGYDLQALRASVAASVRAAAGGAVALPEGRINAETDELLSRLEARTQPDQG